MGLGSGEFDDLFFDEKLKIWEDENGALIGGGNVGFRVISILPEISAIKNSFNRRKTVKYLIFVNERKRK